MNSLHWYDIALIFAASFVAFYGTAGLTYMISWLIREWRHR